jgi:3-deoxy-D-manno-octulosonic-acid transferase
MKIALGLYNGVWNAALVLGLPRAFLRGRPEELRERLGYSPQGGPRRPLWIHAASVGEAAAARSLVRAIRNATGERIALSAMTRSGKARAAEAEPDLGPFHPPLDAPQCVERAFSRLAPKSLILVETEIWPNLLLGARARGIPWGIASGRISSRTRRAPKPVLDLYREMLSRASAIGARTAADEEGFLELGADPGRLEVTGDLKEDGEVPPREEFRTDIPRWIAACTREGEEKLVLDALGALSERHPRGVLTLAPRHPERFEEVAELVLERGLPLRRWKERDLAPLDAWSVLLVDEMGVLAEAYRDSAVAFLGGSLLPWGGHNPFEAAACGRVVIVGPHTENCEHLCVRLLSAGGALRVGSASELVQTLDHLFENSAECAERGSAAHREASRLAGSGRRTVEFFQERGLL